MHSKYITMLKSVKLFDNMTSEDIYKVLGCLQAYVSSYRKGEYLYTQENPFSDIGIVLDGGIDVMKEYRDGNYQIISRLERCETFGEDVVCSMKQYAPYSLIANANTTVLYIKGDKLIDESSTKCEYRSRVNLNMLKRMAEYSMYMNKKMEYSNIISLNKRIVIFLLDQASEKNADEFVINMNREQMARYLNGTRPSVSKVLRQLKEAGYIEYFKNEFRILNKKGLLDRINK